tara:strand:+ start:2019 stop:2405 length:387 start_codon:yes stop_codon:yes gene_type:complete
MIRRMRELDWKEYDVMVKDKEPQPKEQSPIIKQVGKLTVIDHVKLEEAEQSYGDSWKQRGGVGAFMMLARKWDRLEKQVTEQGYDIFQAITYDDREEGVLDDIRDLRRYLFLVEAEVYMRQNGKRKAR